MDAYKRDGLEFEVTGVSRSGRVRKKSSKLMDFESSSSVIESKIKKPKLQSPQEQARKKKTESQVQSPVPHVTHTIHVAQIHHPPSSKLSPVQPRKMPKLSPMTEQSKKKIEPSSDYETQSQSTASESEDEELNKRLHIAEYNKKNLSLDTVELAEDEILPATKKKTPSPRKPKKTVSPKQEAKPKTQAVVPAKPKIRYTAYMLWSKEKRKELLKEDSSMEFSAISKRLGELWAVVPNMEKYNWTNRAKRLAEKNQMIPPKIFSIKSNQMNLPSTNSPKKSVSLSFNKSPPSRSFKSGGDALKDPTKEIKMFRAIELQPIDVAAYLRLLGESLTVIGERLKEHNGQITVSGSLSVLLDSLLCALGSLICLTQQIPAIGTQNTTSLSQTLDNIAYIMPGL
ncbi:HMG box-containing protein 4-like [Copidosoma floridanum]|uniref:HMG box-containing protein 4-like n=1 Tax=Copidosoma floridanum TaxID=29053 RepID=UPI0006C9AB01|nr:HMG box-containing protein 4-like [Copidosoma floridanum]XP_014206179.1 HMG box-containing protein 4-like [Copidosoma floridanum]XP_014206180.1 HMG box-containing protein 4-like [Copidosoma floridanum]